MLLLFAMVALGIMLTLGIALWDRSTPGPNTEKRAGCPTLVEVLAVVGLLGIMGIMAAALLPMAGDNSRKSKTQCLSQVKSLCRALTVYASEWDFFPHKDRWIAETSGYLEMGGAVYHCPIDWRPQDETSYEMTSTGSGLSFSVPEKDLEATVILIEATDGVANPRHLGEYNVGYADGHADSSSRSVGQKTILEAELKTTIVAKDDLYSIEEEITFPDLSQLRDYWTFFLPGDDCRALIHDPTRSDLRAALIRNMIGQNWTIEALDPGAITYPVRSATLRRHLDPRSGSHWPRKIGRFDEVLTYLCPVATRPEVQLKFVGESRLSIELPPYAFWSAQPPAENSVEDTVVKGRRVSTASLNLCDVERNTVKIRSRRFVGRFYRSWVAAAGSSTSRTRSFPFFSFLLSWP